MYRVDIEKIANLVLNTHLPIASQNLAHELDKTLKFIQLHEAYKRDENRLKEEADEVTKILQKLKKAE